jgi:aryl-alcohol dehydrogenase-like predicted oxidoreductase
LRHGRDQRTSTSKTSWDADIGSRRIPADVEASLGVFGGGRLDLYYLHGVDGAEPVEEGLFSLSDLRDEGKLARIGLSNGTVATLEDDGWVREDIGEAGPGPRPCGRPAWRRTRG